MRPEELTLLITMGMVAASYLAGFCTAYLYFDTRRTVAELREELWESKRDG